MESTPFIWAGERVWGKYRAQRRLSTGLLDSFSMVVTPPGSVSYFNPRRCLCNKRNRVKPNAPTTLNPCSTPDTSRIREDVGVYIQVNENIAGREDKEPKLIELVESGCVSFLLHAECQDEPLKMYRFLQNNTHHSKNYHLALPPGKNGDCNVYSLLYLCIRFGSVVTSLNILDNWMKTNRKKTN